MKQSLAILQMPIVELEQELSNILEENPVLEAVEDDGSDDLYDFDNNESNNLSEDIEDTQDKDLLVSILLVIFQKMDILE